MHKCVQARRVCERRLSSLAGVHDDWTPRRFEAINSITPLLGSGQRTTPAMGESMMCGCGRRPIPTTRSAAPRALVWRSERAVKGRSHHAADDPKRVSAESPSARLDRPRRPSCTPQPPRSNHQPVSIVAGLAGSAGSIGNPPQSRPAEAMLRAKAGSLSSSSLSLVLLRIRRLRTHVVCSLTPPTTPPHQHRTASSPSTACLGSLATPCWCRR